MTLMTILREMLEPKEQEETAIDDANNFGKVLQRACRDRDYWQRETQRLNAILEARDQTIASQVREIQDKDERYDHLRRAHAYAEAGLRSFLDLHAGVRINMERAANLAAPEHLQKRVDQLRIVA